MGGDQPPVDEPAEPPAVACPQGRPTRFAAEDEDAVRDLAPLLAQGGTVDHARSRSARRRDEARLADPFLPALLTGLVVAVDHPSPAAAWERLRSLWTIIRTGLDLPEPIAPIAGLPQSLDPPVDPPDGNGAMRLAAAARRPGPGLWQAVLHTDGELACVRVMRCPPDTDHPSPGPAAGVGVGGAAATVGVGVGVARNRWAAVGAAWSKLERDWDAVRSAGVAVSPAIIGETRIRVALDRDGGRDLASLPLPGAEAGWSRRWGTVAPGARLWETSCSDDVRACRNLVLVVPPEQELAVDHALWARGDGTLPPLARYFARAAMLRYQLHVFDGGRPTGALRRRLDEIVDDLLAAQPVLTGRGTPFGSDIPLGSDIPPGHDVPPGREGPSVQVGASVRDATLPRRFGRDRALAATAASRLADMQRTVRRLGTAMTHDLTASAVPLPAVGPFAADVELCRWFAGRVEDERADLRAVLDRAAAVAPLVASPSVDVTPSRPAIITERYGDRMRADGEPGRSAPVVGLITALPEEFAAVRLFLDTGTDLVLPDDPNLYLRSDLRTPRGLLPVVVSQLTRPGNNVAAAMCSALLAGFPTVRDVIMLGIAAAIPSPDRPDHHVRLGDVVVATEGVVQYDNVKLVGDAEPVLREPPHTPAAYLLSRVRRLAADEFRDYRPWEDYLATSAGYKQFRRPPAGSDILLDPVTGARRSHPSQRSRRRGLPMIHHGRIGSANILLRDPAIRDRLRDAHRILAVEMEGSGVADGAWLRQVGHLVVRGTCDYADQAKNDVWHNYASLAAAAYTRALLDLYEPPHPPSPSPGPSPSAGPPPPPDRGASR
ncbi:BN6_48550 family protein [Frankia sp. AiPs1]|uniref:CATRA conflict system CASPASE/TPR repeat-associated protein n=1 Tax=Frankia sp. AiPs1 TaxID=573493 RepID=UPI0020449E7D|nr:CATRA conflict system CASPASE/TPR repeat-associated protein [Frankia sp. AiPs1]MCM3921036.1 BN6_48550 family protein [Frankia sp. AiPs1]